MESPNQLKFQTAWRKAAESWIIGNHLNRLVSSESTTAVPQAAKAKGRWTYYGDGDGKNE